MAVAHASNVEPKTDFKTLVRKMFVSAGDVMSDVRGRVFSRRGSFPSDPVAECSTTLRTNYTIIIDLTRLTTDLLSTIDTLRSSTNRFPEQSVTKTKLKLQRLTGYLEIAGSWTFVGIFRFFFFFFRLHPFAQRLQLMILKTFKDVRTIGINRS